MADGWGLRSSHRCPFLKFHPPVVVGVAPFAGEVGVEKEAGVAGLDHSVGGREPGFGMARPLTPAGRSNAGARPR